MLLNCGVGEDSWESHGQQGDQTSQSSRKSSWIFLGRTDAEAPILWPPDIKSLIIGKDLDPGKIEGKRKRGWQRVRWLDSITDSMNMNLSKPQQVVNDRQPGKLQSLGLQSWRWLSNWTTFHLNDYEWMNNTHCLSKLMIFFFLKWIFKMIPIVNVCNTWSLPGIVLNNLYILTHLILTL